MLELVGSYLHDFICPQCLGGMLAGHDDFLSWLAMLESSPHAVQPPKKHIGILKKGSPEAVCELFLSPKHFGCLAAVEIIAVSNPSSRAHTGQRCCNYYKSHLDVSIAYI